MNTSTAFDMIITVYNDATSITTFLDMLAQQALLPENLIIVDGGSTDNSIEVINSLKYDYNFKIDLIKNRDRKNIPEGFNQGIRRSNAEYIILTCIGNTLPTNFNSTLIYNAQKNPFADILYAPVHGRKTSLISHIFTRYFLNQNSKSTLGANNRGVCLKKSIFDRVGMFLEKFLYAGEDTEFFLRCDQMNVISLCCDETYVTWHVPESLREINEKMRVNAIAELQMFSVKSLFRRHFVHLFLLAIILVISLFSNFFAVVFIFISITSIMVHRGIDIVTFFLGVYCKGVIIYFLLRYVKYRSLKYRVAEY